MKKLQISIILLLFTMGLSQVILAQDHVSKTMKKLEFREKPDYYIQNLPSVKYRYGNAAYNAFIVASKEEFSKTEFQNNEAVISYLKGKEFKWQIALKTTSNFSGPKVILYVKANKVIQIIDKDLLGKIKLKQPEGYIEIKNEELQLILGEALELWRNAFEDF